MVPINWRGMRARRNVFGAMGCGCRSAFSRLWAKFERYGIRFANGTRTLRHSGRERHLRAATLEPRAASPLLWHFLKLCTALKRVSPASVSKGLVVGLAKTEAVHEIVHSLRFCQRNRSQLQILPSAPSASGSRWRGDRLALAWMVSLERGLPRTHGPTPRSHLWRPRYRGPSAHAFRPSSPRRPRSTSRCPRCGSRWQRSPPQATRPTRRTRRLRRARVRGASRTPRSSLRPRRPAAG